MSIRLALPADALAVAQVHVQSWQAAYRDLLPQEYLDALLPEDRAPHYNFSHDDALQPRTLVATENDIIHGFVTTMPSRESDMQDAAELAALYLAPDQWGKGLGTALLQAATESLLTFGWRQAYLWVLDGNERAAAFYQRHGWRADGTRKTDVIWGIDVTESRYLRTLDG